MPMPAANESRYAGIARALATRALDMAADASAFRPRAGEVRESMLIARPAARVLLQGGDDQAWPGVSRSMIALAQRVTDAAGDDARMPEVVDGVGHRREVYYPLLLHQLLSVVPLWRLHVDGPPGGLLTALTVPIWTAHERDRAVDFSEPAGRPRIAGALWRALAVLELAMLLGETDTGLAALGVIRQVADRPGPGGALHGQAADDTPDAWVYRELTGLHALHLAAQVARDAGWSVRCRQVAQYHLQHTQPDYTTYQPWALAAFAEHATTATFAEQQLHDVQTHLAIEGPSGALLPGLLLADAVATLDGRMLDGWRRFRFQG